MRQMQLKETRGYRIKSYIMPYRMILMALFILLAVLGLSAPNFMTQGNMLDIVRVISINGIMAVGMTFVLLTGGIDLSAGSVFAVSGAVTASLIQGSYSDYITSNAVKLPVLAAVMAGLIAGCLIGLINGWIVTRLKIEPFIATLAMMTFGRGITYLYTGGYPVNFKPLPEVFAWFGKGYVGFLPVPALFFILVCCAGSYLLTYTSYGRSLYAIGGNRETARLSGIPVERNICLTYTIMGGLAGLAGIIMTSRVASASPVAGDGYEMDVIAGVVIGGTLQSGGKGSVFGTVIGCFIFGVIENGLNILGMPTYFKMIIKGMVLIAAIGYNTLIPEKKVRQGAQQ